MVLISLRRQFPSHGLCAERCWLPRVGSSSSPLLSPIPPVCPAAESLPLRRCLPLHLFVRSLRPTVPHCPFAALALSATRSCRCDARPTLCSARLRLAPSATHTRIAPAALAPASCHRSPPGIIMSFLRMSSVGVLPPEQKLKRGEVLLQYTRVLAPPDYTPIPFNKQQVR